MHYYEELSARTNPTFCKGRLKIRHIVYGIFSSILMTYFVLWISNPGCPSYIPKPDLNMDRYKGTWYEVYRPFDARFESGDCVTVSYLDDDYEPELYFKVVNA